MKPGMIGLAAACILPPFAALADLKLCNNTSARHSVAVGYKSGEQWVSEGWWNLDPGDCRTPIKGDLKYRKYYYRAQSNDRDFLDENYVFCTQGSAFTIEGDKDCEARGYRKSRFREIDTGKSVDFVFSFSDAVSVEKAAAAPAPAPAPEEEIGKWGEPYASGTAIFQDCVSETEAPFCTFHADGTKFFVYDDERTPGAVMSALRTHLPGDPIEVRGDLADIYDRTADVVLRSVQARAPNRWDETLRQLQGQWYSVNDPNSQFTVIGSELENTYDGKYGGLEYLDMRDTCEHFDGGNILARTEEETGDVLCYSIEELGAFNLTLMYLPAANFLDYRKLD